jgi:hypothetical protein
LVTIFVAVVFTTVVLKRIKNWKAQNIHLSKNNSRITKNNVHHHIEHIDHMIT